MFGFRARGLRVFVLVLMLCQSTIYCGHPSFFVIQLPDAFKPPPHSLILVRNGLLTSIT